MTTTALARQALEKAEVIEQVVIAGDLSKLDASQRVTYYRTVCESVGLNPYTKPFEYILLNGKLTLYARRDAADQLRRIYGISLSRPAIEYRDDLVIATVDATDKSGRTDSDAGAVNIGNLKGEAKANAILKCITKAKRRVTLSICGLGWMDETEVDTVSDARRVNVDTETGEILPQSPDENFYPDEDEPLPKPLASQSQLNKMHALGIQFHGDKDAWNAARPTWVSKASKGAITSSKDLTPAQADWIISSLDKRLGEKAQAAEQEATQEPEPIESPF